MKTTRYISSIALLAGAALAWQQAPAQGACGFNFMNPPVCQGEQCNLLFNFVPTGQARVVADPEFGAEPGINFAANSIFELGDNGLIDFGAGGGVEATYGQAGVIANCVPQPPGPQPYMVNVTTGGWFEFSANNRMVFGENNVFALAAGSSIDGRLLVDSEGDVGISSQGGDLALANVDINAEGGVTVGTQGGVTLGDLAAGQGGVNVTAEGSVNIGAIDSGGAVAVTAPGDISIGDIGRAHSLDLLITAAEGGTITVGDNQVSLSPGPVTVTCGETQQCDDYVIGGDGSAGDGGNGGGNGGGSGAGEDCDDADRDPNACVAGGAMSPWWWLLAGLIYLAARAGKKRRQQGR